MTRPPLFPHQAEDLATLLRAPAHLLAATPGAGKTRVVVEAATRLARAGTIDAVIVVCPAPIKSVWVDPDPALGEWVKWSDHPATLEAYDDATDFRRLTAPLVVLVTNPEMLRRTEAAPPPPGSRSKKKRILSRPRLDPLVAWAKTRRALLVLDESWLYQNPTAAQTEAVYLLRRACARVVELNGTPGEPKDLYTQFMILDPGIFDGMNRFQFRAKYCTMGGFMKKDVVGYQALDDFHRRTAPYITERDTTALFRPGDPPVYTQIEAPLTPATWRVYTQMRDDMLAWLDASSSAVATQAGVAALRLAQIANGFVGGVESEDPDLLDTAPPLVLREVGAEKLDALVAWLAAHWTDEKLLIFTRFRPDVERTVARLAEGYPTHVVRPLYGSQRPEDRREAVALLAPGGDPRPAIIVANTQSGGAGLTLTASALCVFLGHDHSLRLRRQAEGRIDRPTQTRRCTYLDVLATGPKGERTVDHGIAARVRAKGQVADLTLDGWRRLLRGELTSDPAVT